MINPWTWFVSLFKPRIYNTGALPDPRGAERKERDYMHEERLLAAVPDPFGNPQITAAPYPVEWQKSTSSCVPHAVGLGLAIERKQDTGTYTRLSPIFAYHKRANFPEAGSWPIDIFDIYRKHGSCLYATCPTPMTEAMANKVVLTSAMYLEAELFKGKEYYTIGNHQKIAEIATVAMKGHGVPILIYATYDEWAREYPVIINPRLRLDMYTPVRHAVCVLPWSGFTKNGVRYVTIMDSSPFGNIVLRHLSEAFIRARCYGANYWDTVTIMPTFDRPKYKFTRSLKVGSGGAEVLMLQKLLISEGLLPTDCATGNFFGRTLAGVRAFQIKYADDILKPISLTEPTNLWGPRCIAKANLLCV